MRDNLVEVFKDTRVVSNREFKAETDRLKNFDTIVYDGGLKFEGNADEVGELPDIRLIRGGTVQVGYKYTHAKNRTAILNFADAVKPGGWVEDGAPTQEECICRCTNLYETLTTEASHNGYYKVNLDFIKGQYYSVYTDRVLYARDVVIFKDDTTYEYIAPKLIDVITCPAPNTNLSGESAIQIYTRRMEQILLSAHKNGVKTLILGAWGCGAFGQDPYTIAKAFALVLNNYADLFEHIVFAIRPTISMGNYRDDDTFNQFRLVLTKFYEGSVKE